MLTKANVGTILTFIAFFSISDASAMLTRLRPLTRTNKVNLRKYSTKEPKDLRKLAAQQFKLTDPLPISTMYTLLKHHQEKLENLEIGAVFSSIGAIVGAYPLGIDLCSSWIDQSPMFLSQPIITACITLSAVSLLSFSQCIIPCEKIEYIIKKLEHAFETGQITPANIHDIENKTQEDIFNEIRKLTIIPSNHISRLEKKGEVLPHVWDINDNKILKDTLNGKYNSSDYTLYLQDKE